MSSTADSDSDSSAFDSDDGDTGSEYACVDTSSEISCVDLAMQEPGQEGGSQKLKRSRSEGAAVEGDNPAGALLASRKSRRSVEVRTPR